MKKTALNLIVFGLLLIALIITPKYSISKCGGAGLYFWPKKTNISTNSLFIIEGYFFSQSIIDSLNAPYNVFLTDGANKIKLLVVNKYKGDFKLTQALLKPEKELELGKEYELLIENIAAKASIVRFNDSTNINEKVKWLVKYTADNEAPEWINTPVYKSSSFAAYGCGPSVHAIFQFKATDKHEYLIKTIVKNKKIGSQTTYIIAPEGNTIELGHGMCEGAFTFKEGDPYEVTFALMDINGNLCGNSTTLTFKGPGKSSH